VRPRYRFAGFTLSPVRRQLLHEGREVPLVPRYLDLLLLLVEKRHEAVHRREIFDRVWSDVVVSDGALTQAVRTLRRALGDFTREPRFLRTVSRHGYQFVFPEVVEEPDLGPVDGPAIGAAPLEAGAALPEALPAGSDVDRIDEGLDRLLRPGPLVDDDERREAAEALHALSTAETLRRLGHRPGHERARALLRAARFDVPGAGPVPLLGVSGGLVAALVLVGLRLRRAVRLAGARWTSASAGGAAAGVLAGIVGGLALMAAPGSHVSARVIVALALVGALVGGIGAAGVGAGLAAAEALARSWRGPALVVLGSLGGGLVGASAHLLGRWTLEDVFGHPLGAVGGGFEGLVLGGAAGLGYALATWRPDGGMASPHGRARLWAAALTGLSCAVAALVLSRVGGHLSGVSLDFLARSFRGSQVGLAPLAHLFGEETVGPLTGAVLSVCEGLLFGGGLALGLTRRPPREAETAPRA
jgi:DNA-binding winged helix-turn-helix (wHTH) protein